MASDMKPPPTALTNSSGITDESFEKPSSKPEEAVERSRSNSSHGSEDGHLEKQPDDTSAPLQPTESSAEPIYPSAKERIPIIVALILAILLLALVCCTPIILFQLPLTAVQDRTIIATAIPRITDEFDSLNDIGWYGSAFMLTSCGFQLLLGRIYTFYTPKYVFLVIIGLFEVGSAICGAAPNSIAFILGRAIAGTGSAGTFCIYSIREPY